MLDIDIINYEATQNFVQSFEILIIKFSISCTLEKTFL